MVDEYKDRLAEAMRDAKMSTQELADSLKISYQAVRKALRHGKLGLDNHRKAVRLLGVRDEWLANGKGPKRPVDEPVQDTWASPEAVQIARQFDALHDDERRLFNSMWPGYIQQVKGAASASRLGNTSDSESVNPPQHSTALVVDPFAKPGYPDQTTKGGSGDGPMTMKGARIPRTGNATSQAGRRTSARGRRGS